MTKRKSSSLELGVGSTIWVQDRPWNCIGLERWSAYKITGETSRSWIVGPALPSWNQYKVPKGPVIGDRWVKTRNGRHRVALSKVERDDRVYVEVQGPLIAKGISYCQDADMLRQIAELIGMEEVE